MTHRIICCDGYHECYACGIVSEIVSDDDTDATMDRLPCRPGGWAHPPYLMGTDPAGRLIVETCAAHPYESCLFDGPIRAALEVGDWTATELGYTYCPPCAARLDITGDAITNDSPVPCDSCGRIAEYVTQGQVRELLRT